MTHILVVEDEGELEHIFSFNLTRRGHTVVEATSVAEADAQARATTVPFELVLLDINLPDGSGWDLLRRWQRQPLARQPKVIVMTAIQPSVACMHEFAPDAVLAKPFPIDVMLHTIQRTLQGTDPNIAQVLED